MGTGKKGSTQAFTHLSPDMWGGGGWAGSRQTRLKSGSLPVACSVPSGQSLLSSVSPAKIPGGLSVYLKPLGMLVTTPTSLLGPRSN